MTTYADLLQRVDGFNFSPTAAARLKDAIMADAMAAAEARRQREQAAAEEQAAAAKRLELIERKLGHPEQRARRQRERQIQGAQAWLARIDHVDTSRAHAIRCVDSGQYSAYLARCNAPLAPLAPAVTVKPEPARPAPLRLVPRFDTHDLQTLAAGFGSRIP